jgi:hypothetical protein
MRRSFLRALATLAVPCAAAIASAGSPSESTGRSVRDRAIEVDMRNVDLHLTDTVTLRVRSLRGRFVPTRTDGVANLDDSASYVVEVDAAETAMDARSLNALMNEHVFGHGKKPIRDLEVRVEEGLVKQKGVLDKKIDLPFSAKGSVEATPDGKVRVHSKSIRSLGLPVKPLMKVLGIEMDDLLEVEPGHGLTVDDNDLIMDPGKMLPPPRLRGRVTAARVEGDEVVQTFGKGAPGRLSGVTSQNRIYWRGGRLRFGKLTMTDTDLELVDQDPSDPFDFSVAGYNEMLVAGYSKNTPQGGLKTYMPDYEDVKAGRAGVERPADAAAPGCERP